MAPLGHIGGVPIEELIIAVSGLSFAVIAATLLIGAEALRSRLAAASRAVGRRPGRAPGSDRSRPAAGRQPRRPARGR